MADTDDRRQSSDRRLKAVKNFPNNKRNNTRRSEDKKNVIAYYSILYFSFTSIIALGIASYLYN